MTASPAAASPARILVQVDGAALARWVLWLVEALERRPGTQVFLRITERGRARSQLGSARRCFPGTHVAEAEPDKRFGPDRSRRTRRAARGTGRLQARRRHRPDRRRSVVRAVAGGLSAASLRRQSRRDGARLGSVLPRYAADLDRAHHARRRRRQRHHLRHGLARGSRRRRRRHRSGRLARDHPALEGAVRGHHGFRAAKRARGCQPPDRTIGTSSSVRPRMSPALPPAPPTGFAATDRIGASAGVSSSPATMCGRAATSRERAGTCSPIRSTIFTRIRFR